MSSRSSSSNTFIKKYLSNNKNMQEFYEESCSNESVDKNTDISMELILENFKIFGNSDNLKCKNKNIIDQKENSETKQKTKQMTDNYINPQCKAISYPNYPLNGCDNFNQNGCYYNPGYCAININQYSPYYQLNSPYIQTLPLMNHGIPQNYYYVNYPANYGMNTTCLQQPIKKEDDKQPKLKKNKKNNLSYIDSLIPNKQNEEFPLFDKVINLMLPEITNILNDQESKGIFLKLIKNISSHQRKILWDILNGKLISLCTSENSVPCMIKLMLYAKELPEQQRIVFNLKQNIDTLIYDKYGNEVIICMIENFCPESVFIINSYILTHFSKIIKAKEGVDVLIAFIRSNSNQSFSFKKDFLDAIYPKIGIIINNGMLSPIIMTMIETWNLHITCSVMRYVQANVIELINGRNSCLILDKILELYEEKVSHIYLLNQGLIHSIK